MVTVTARAYADRRDLRRLAAFLMACRAADPRGDYEHVGDLLWGFRHATLDPEHNVRLWETPDAGLVGFAKVEPPGLLWQLHPRHRDGRLRARLFAWGMTRLQGLARGRGVPAQARVHVREDNVATIAFLEQRGFVRADRHLVELVRSLDETIPPPALPAGFDVRGGPGEDETEAYAAMHRDAWGPTSTYTAAVHRRLMDSPGYQPELHPVVVAPDGTFAAACICWLDPVNRLGEIEPLGTRPAFRRRGLARAVVLEALARLRARGATTALVYGASANEPARRLYAATGFRPDRAIFDYVKAL